MKLRKQLKKLQGYLDDEARERDSDRADLKRLLRKLKHKERELIERVLDEPDVDESARLQRKIRLLHAQRTKGVHALRESGSDGA